MNSIDFGGHRSKVKVMMGIIDKYGVCRDATLCVVIFQLQSAANELVRSLIVHIYIVSSLIESENSVFPLESSSIQLV